MPRFRAALFLLASCAAPSVRGPAEVPVSALPSGLKRPAIAAPSRSDDPRDDWHWRLPSPIAGTREAGYPLYPAADTRLAFSLEGCNAVTTGGKAYVLCDAGLGRVHGASLDFSFGRVPALAGLVPCRVNDVTGDLWVTLCSGDDGAHDWFSDDGLLTARLHDGQWSRLETTATPAPYRKGFVAPKLPAAGRSAACADFSCLEIVPSFVGLDVDELPDFRALAGKISWIHEGELTADYAFAIDPKGPVYVLMRAVERMTKKRGIGVARWAPGGPARFDWLPAALGAGRFSVTRAEAEGGAAAFEIAFEGKGSRDTVRFDGRAWTKSTVPMPAVPTSPASEASPWALGEARGELVKREADGTFAPFPLPGSPHVRSVVGLAADDLFVSTAFGVYRTKRPSEVWVQTQRWGPLHEMAPPADESCKTPFAVLDAFPRAKLETLFSFRRSYANEWGTLSTDDDRARTVSMEIGELFVLGAPFDNVTDANAYLERTPNWMTLNAQPPFRRVVCARPVAPTPFVLPPMPPADP